jgi:hypothetical protein
LGRGYLIANAVLWAAAIIASAILGAPRLLTFILLPALAAISLLLAGRRPGAQRRDWRLLGRHRTVGIATEGDAWRMSLDSGTQRDPAGGVIGARGPMKRTWTIIAVADVLGSVKWYQALFGQPARLPAHDYFGQILDSDETVLLCLHAWGAHEHPSLTSPGRGQPGNGLLLFFRVDDFDLALERARALVAQLEEEPHVNPNTRTKEFSLRDPDGYYLTISALSAA